MRCLKIALSALVITAMIGEPAFAAANPNKQNQNQQDQKPRTKAIQAPKKATGSKENKDGGFTIHAGKSKGKDSSGSSWWTQRGDKLPF